jgi:ankyrin repeat protein
MEGSTSSQGHIKDTSGTTALHVAARRGFPRIQQLLIDRGADITLSTHEGESLRDLETEGAGLRQLTEELALFEQLPDAITLVDAFHYVRIYVELDHAENMGSGSKCALFAPKQECC